MSLSNCLNLLSDRIEVESYDPASLNQQLDKVAARLHQYDRILVAPQVTALDEELSALGDRVWRVPTVSFSAYHPDICYIVHGNKPLKGPLGDYHSLIAYAAFKSGLAASQALDLYHEDTFDALGYFNRWQMEKTRLQTTFRARGFDITKHFLSWNREGAFMYSLNHPKIRCIRDVAMTILNRAGLPAEYIDALPHDNLANGPVYPVYPEIATGLGITGSYRFKLAGRYRFITLREFVYASFELYAATPENVIRPEFAHAFKRAVDLHGGTA